VTALFPAPVGSADGAGVTPTPGFLSTSMKPVWVQHPAWQFLISGNHVVTWSSIESGRRSTTVSKGLAPDLRLSDVLAPKRVLAEETKGRVCGAPIDDQGPGNDKFSPNCYCLTG
jgi:hypothetical protein